MKFYSFTQRGREIIQFCSKSPIFRFGRDPHDSFDPGPVEHFVIVTPHTLFSSIYSSEADVFFWKEIHNAWKKIQSRSSCSNLHAWRTIWSYGEEIVPGFGVFRLRDSQNRCYFCLLPDEDLFIAANNFIGLIYTFMGWRYVTKNFGIFHAAGVVRDELAYLFVGPSGAGKSTLATFSSMLNYNVIHDDIVLVYPGLHQNEYMVSDYFMNFPGVPLKSIFFIVKDTKDRLLPLSSITTAKRLFLSFLDTPGHSIFITAKLMEKIFLISTAIAHNVTAYELHFRKAPDFWTLINTKFK